LFRFAGMITIRKALVHEAAMIARFQQLMALETESLSLDPEIVLKGVESVFSDPAKGTYMVAETDQKLVACMLLTREWSDWRNGTFLWIQSVYVDPAYRKQGIYSQLYSHIKELVLNSNEYLGLRLYVVMNNTVAQKTYSSTGMDGDHYKLFEWIK
jgi:ribosomal protein S18 acetylase RimI-like enzyme